MDSPLEVRALCSRLDKFESDIVMSEFLHDMDELERLQGLAPVIDRIGPKRRQEQDVNMEREPKKAKRTDTERLKPLSTRHVCQASPAILPRKRRIASWLRRKQELNALRSESEALETHVVFLKMQHSRMAKQSRSRGPTEAQQVWKTVAAIARQESRIAQEENARLRTELQIYTNASETFHAQALQASSRRETLLTVESAFENAVRVGMIMSRRLHFDNSGVFDMLENKVAARRVELDTIVNETHQTLQESTSERIQICRDNSQHSATSVEFRQARLLPFGEAATAKTIWEIIELGGLMGDRQFCAVGRSDNIVGIASRFTVPLDSTNISSVSVDVYAVAKRFAVPSGIVVLIESRSQWSVSNSTSGAWTHTTEEDGWVAVSELSHWSDDSPPKACQLRTTMKLRPDVDSRGESRSTLTGAVGDVVIPSFREILSSHHQSVENTLLDSTMKSQVDPNYRNQSQA